jgi:hypothetical protein
MTPPPEPAPATVAAPDVTRPNIARAYDYLLGGKDHFPADRELADRLLAIYPGTRQMVRENRRFLVRALDYVLVQGVRQYVDLGAGLPTSPAVHDIVRRHSTGPILYVDNDPVVVNHLWALACSPSHHVHALPADLTAPATVLRQIREAGVIDLARPVCLILAMVLHFQEATTARNLVSAYVDQLAPGSHVIITVGAGDPAIGDQITRAYDAAPLYNHSRDDVASFFTGLDLIGPGITDARAWQPGWRTPAPFFDRAGQVLAGAGVKP